MSTLRTLASTLIILAMILPIIAPLAPQPTLAQAQTQASIWTSRDVYDRTIYYNMKVYINITDPNVDTTTTKYVEANIIVAGTPNPNLKFYLDSDIGQYVAMINITSDGYVEFYVWDDTAKQFIYNVTLDGRLTREGQTIVIQYTPAGATEPITATLTLVGYQLMVYGRVIKGIVWMPRLCCDAQAIYNNTAAYKEWMIYVPGIDTTANPYINVSLTITDPATGMSWQAWILFHYTGNEYWYQVTDVAEGSKLVDLLVSASQQTTRWFIKGIDFANPVIRGSDLTVTADVYDASNNYVVTVERTMRFYVSEAVVDYNVDSIVYGLDIYIYDADWNLNNYQVESYAATIDGIPITLQETSALSGVFYIHIDLLQAPYNTIYAPDDNTATLEFNDLKLDTCDCINQYCPTQVKITIPFHTADFDVLEQEIAIRSPAICCPIPKITLRITDVDLDFPGGVDTIVATATLPAGQNITDVPVTYVGSTVVPFTITILVGLSNGEYVNITPTQDIHLVFREVQSGDPARGIPAVVEADIELQYLDWYTVNAYAASQNAQIINITVIVTDMYTADIEPKSLEDTAKFGKVAIELDRYTLPVSKLVYPVDIDQPAQVVYVTVYDNGSNTNCCQVDTIPATQIQLTLTLYDGDTAVLQNSSYGPVLEIALVDETNSRVGTCYFEISDLVETDINTGVFTGTLQVYSIVNGVQYAGCPAPLLKYAKLTIKYVSPSIGYATATISFEIYDAQLTVLVADTGEPATEITYGTTLLIRVYNPDANVDNNVNETIVVAMPECPLCPTTTITPIFLTAVNETSDYYEGTLVVDSTIAPSCADMTFWYTDPTPVPRKDQMDQWLKMMRNWYVAGELYGYLFWPDTPSTTHEYTLTVTCKPAVFTVTYFLTLPDGTTVSSDATGKYIPPVNDTIIMLSIADPDRNLYANAIDNVSTADILVELVGTGIQVRLSLGIDKLINETDVNTGVFAINITMAELVQLLAEQGVIAKPDPRELIGKTIRFQYLDRSAECAGLVTTSAWIPVEVTVYGETGELTVVDAITGQKKPFYECTDPVTGTIGDTLRVTVKDIDLLYLWLAGQELALNVSIVKLDGTRVLWTIKLATAGYETFEVDGVTMVRPIYEALVDIYCLPPAATQGEYIPANYSDIVYISYVDEYNAEGKVQVITEQVPIGEAIVTPPHETAAVKEIKYYVVKAGRAEPVDTLVAGETGLIKVFITYEPATMRFHVGGKEFYYAFIVIKDAEGKIVFFDVKPVEIGTYDIGFVWTPEKPGTYTAQFIVITDDVEWVPLSEWYQFTVEVG